MGMGDPGAAFTAITQLGTEAAVLVYFRKDIVRISKAWCGAWLKKVPWSDPDARMGWLVIVGSVPIVALGVLGESLIDNQLRNLWLTATMLAVGALVLAFADYTAKNARELHELTWRDGLIYGFAQAAALIPGVSRSGGTISAGLLMGYTREAAARYSFLLAIPAVMGSGFYKLLSVGEDPTAPAWGPIIAATVVAFVIGYAIIAWLLRYISTHTFTPFVWYRLGLAALLFGLLATGVVQPTS